MDGAAERLHGLDALRGGALLLGVALHATMSFIPGIEGWHVRDEPSVPLSILFFVIHVFRMTTFFFIAGFFAHMAFHKRGLGGFVRDRLLRIAVPMVVGWPFLLVGVIAAFIVGAIVMNGGALPSGPPPERPQAPPGTIAPFLLLHLWFLYVLLWLYALTLAARGPIVAIDRDGRLRRFADRTVAVLVKSPVAPVVLGAPLVALLLVFPGWHAREWNIWYGVRTPEYALVPDAPAFVVFAVAFGFGWLAHRQADLLLAVWRRRWAVNLALAVGFTAACLALVGLTPGDQPDLSAWRRAAYAACYMIATWCWVFALTGIAMRFFSGYSPARRYAADASYWIYLVHLPLVMLLQAAVKDVPAPAEMKFVLILAVALPILFGSYQVLVRYSFIGRVLNGRRFPRWTKSAAVASPIAGQAE